MDLFAELDSIIKDKNGEAIWGETGLDSRAGCCSGPGWTLADDLLNKIHVIICHSEHEQGVPRAMTNMIDKNPPRQMSDVCRTFVLGQSY